MRVAERFRDPWIPALFTELQWGRNMRVAERGPILTAFAFRWGLQWGRNMRVAESPFPVAVMVDVVRFNGAAT